MSFWKKLLYICKSLPDLLFPKTLRVIELESLTAEEFLKILPSSRDVSEETLALFDYSNPMVKELIWELKYKGNLKLADKMGEILFDNIEAELMERNVYEKFGHVLLLPAPISDKRKFERGWNQAEMLTRSIKKRDVGQKMKHLPHQLVKVVHTISQTHTGSRNERLVNIKNSMKLLNPLSVRGKFAVVVDDVTTTGATFAEIKRVLKEAGARKVLCVALAH